MHRTIVIVVFQVLWFIAASAASASEAGGSAKEGAAGRTWVRRQGQVAKVLPKQLTKFQEQSARSAELEPALRPHNVKNMHLFMIELEPGKHYALRYYEYVGDHFIDDMRRLEQQDAYRKWTDELDSCLEGGWSDVESVFFTIGQQRSSVDEERVRRIGQVVGLRPEMVEPYVLLHAHTWPGVLAAIREGNIRNYSIFLAPADSKLYLFAYFEYVGNNIEADMAQIGADPETQAWIKFTDEGCQLPLSTRKSGEWWARMERLSEQK